MSTLLSTDTIVALATAPGVGAIAVLRLSGPQAISITESVFDGKKLTTSPSHRAYVGNIVDGTRVLDEVVVTLFKGPKSFTKEDVVEIACHGSPYIIKEISQLLIRKGARSAKPGEFTQRAFLNGRFDLAQAEAVADLIASDSHAAHQIALQQMRGGFSQEIKNLREQLIHFASLVELELDFSEEDVEFADRSQLRQLINEIKRVIDRLVQSFALGNVLKNGVPTVIVGKPNAGKSTLLNTLLHEEKAIVSEIPGTTRDFIEDELTVEGVTFRFIDTAGLRETVDKIEAIGVQRTREKMSQAALIIYLFDVNTTSEKELIRDLEELQGLKIPYLIVGNKVDTFEEVKLEKFNNFDGIIYISAKKDNGIEELKERLLETINYESLRNNDTLVSNLRHYESLRNTRESLEQVLEGMQAKIPGDLLAQHIRQALFHLGEITGEINTEDLLDNIFSKFCIGK
ncbi:MAG: tRNA uridine-5-carboxymethylaminomethyl(34) synthesis GTPase MnmE [Cytophagaceae bacterium]